MGWTKTKNALYVALSPGLEIMIDTLASAAEGWDYRCS
jgi:hypothetical protein